MPNLDVRITSMYPPGSQGGTRAIASATIAGCFAVRGIKIVEGGKDGLFVSMPSRKTQDGYKDICFPVTAEFRKELHQAVLGAYEQALTMAQTAAPQTTAPGLEEAREKLRYYSMSPEERYAYDEHLNAIMIQNDVLSTAKFEGREEGLAEGLAEGREEGLIEGREEGRVEERLETARRMRSDGLSMEMVVRYTGLSEEEINNL